MTHTQSVFIDKTKSEKIFKDLLDQAEDFNYLNNKNVADIIEKLKKSFEVFLKENLSDLNLKNKQFYDLLEKYKSDYLTEINKRILLTLFDIRNQETHNIEEIDVYLGYKYLLYKSIEILSLLFIENNHHKNFSFITSHHNFLKIKNLIYLYELNGITIEEQDKNNKKRIVFIKSFDIYYCDCGEPVVSTKYNKNQVLNVFRCEKCKKTKFYSHCSECSNLVFVEKTDKKNSYCFCEKCKRNILSKYFTHQTENEFKNLISSAKNILNGYKIISSNYGDKKVKEVLQQLFLEKIDNESVKNNFSYFFNIHNEYSDYLKSNTLALQALIAIKIIENSNNADYVFKQLINNYKILEKSDFSLDNLELNSNSNFKTLTIFALSVIYDKVQQDQN